MRLRPRRGEGCAELVTSRGGAPLAAAAKHCGQSSRLRLRDKTARQQDEYLSILNSNNIISTACISLIKHYFMFSSEFLPRDGAIKGCPMTKNR
jgi:hypothetical protein